MQDASRLCADSVDNVARHGYRKRLKLMWQLRLPLESDCSCSLRRSGQVIYSEKLLVLFDDDKKDEMVPFDCDSPSICASCILPSITTDLSELKRDTKVEENDLDDAFISSVINKLFGVIWNAAFDCQKGGVANCKNCSAGGGFGKSTTYTSLPLSWTTMT